MSHLKPAVLAKSNLRDTPEPSPSPPPSRQDTHSCAESEDPFQDPPGSRRREEGPCQSSYTAGDPLSTISTNDSDAPLARKGTLSEETSWRRILREWKLLLMLENSGSVARDHLASERTFLAYVRTSLTLSSAGVGLVQLFSLSAATADRVDLERYARPLGAAMIGIGLYTLSVGVARYFLVQDALIRGVYPVARISITALSFAVVAMVITVFTVILLRT
ncbi:hypothetical protein BD414DRAFT_416332 [Trametes punicea]|nr:hypothetical protein BD414DRAFT_416332 [Trametes punicea]